MDQNHIHNEDEDMRLWQRSGQGTVAGGWWQLIKTVIGFLLIFGILIYLFVTNQMPNEIKDLGLANTILIIGVLILFFAYNIGLGIAYIYFGKSILARKDWTWKYEIITLPLIYLYVIYAFVYKGGFDSLTRWIIFLSSTMLFIALYRYFWKIRDKIKN